MRYNAVLFDLDGTIIKSEEGILNCVEYALRERGHAVPPRERLYSFIGPPLPTEFARVTGCDAAEAEELTEKYRERFCFTFDACAHRIARTDETVWGDAREGCDREEGHQGGGAYCCDRSDREADGTHAWGIQVDGA